MEAEDVIIIAEPGSEESRLIERPEAVKAGGYSNGHDGDLEEESSGCFRCPEVRPALGASSRRENLAEEAYLDEAVVQGRGYGL